MQWNWVYEMVVIISGLHDGQWYQGTESMWVQISLELPGLPITRETSNDQQSISRPAVRPAFAPSSID